jgi:predicted transcriptional regulator
MSTDPLFLPTSMSRTEQNSLPTNLTLRRGLQELSLQRVSFEQSVSILEKLVVEGTMGPTRLFERLGLKWSVFKELLASLIETGLVKGEWAGKRRVFSPTRDGLIVIEQYILLRDRVTSEQVPARHQVRPMGASTVQKTSDLPNSTSVPSQEEMSGGYAQPRTPYWTAPRGSSTSQVMADTTSRLLCRGCGNPVREVSPHMADALRSSSPRSRHSRAFECDACEVVIFENEFVRGEFVPPSVQKRRS